MILYFMIVREKSEHRNGIKRGMQTRRFEKKN